MDLPVIETNERLGIKVLTFHGGPMIEVDMGKAVKDKQAFAAEYERLMEKYYPPSVAAEKNLKDFQNKTDEQVRAAYKAHLEANDKVMGNLLGKKEPLSAREAHQLEILKEIKSRFGTGEIKSDIKNKFQEMIYFQDKQNRIGRALGMESNTSAFSDGEGTRYKEVFLNPAHHTLGKWLTSHSGMDAEIQRNPAGGAFLGIGAYKGDHASFDKNFAATFPPGGDRLLNEFIKLHEYGHNTGKVSPDVLEAGGDFYAAVRLLKEHPEAREVLQFVADTRAVNILNWGQDQFPYGMSSILAIHKALAMSPQQIAAMSEGDILKQAKAYDSVTIGKEEFDIHKAGGSQLMNQYVAIMDERGMIPNDGGVIEKYAQYIFERGGIKPDASLPSALQKVDLDVLDEAARRVQKEILQAGGGQIKGDAAAKQFMTLEGVKEAIHNIRDRLERVKGMDGPGITPASVSFNKGQLTDSYNHHSGAASAVMTAEKNIANVPGLIETGKHLSSQAAVQMKTLEQNPGVMHAIETLESMKAPGMSGEALTDMRGHVASIMNDPGLAPDVVALRENMDRAEAAWQKAFKESDGNAPMQAAVRQAFQENHAEIFKDSMVPGDAKKFERTLGERTEEFAAELGAAAPVASTSPGQQLPKSTAESFKFS
ncbi:MAG: hypothetical protein KA155_09850 [Alphaproteobacteria bacterium]|jgi:hypothetical protein|nr:hypothetical protein [Alphaproteobacteria bacterium]